VRSTLSKIGTGTDTSGYVLWCPDYANIGGGLDTDANLFMWKSDASSTQPNNDVVDCYGRNTAANFTDAAALPLNTGCSTADPAEPLLSEDLVQDARTLSACMTVTYTGKMLDASGQYCTLTNIPLSSVLTGGAANGPLSVDDCFRYTNRTGRFGSEPVEVLSRPTGESHHFRDEDDGLIRVGTFNVVASETTPIAEAQQPTFIGFAWRGLDSQAANPLVFDFIKNIEWRAAPISGLTHQPSRVVHTLPLVPEILQKLDTSVPGWDSRTEDVGKQIRFQISSGLDRRMIKHQAGKAIKYTGNQLTNLFNDMSRYFPSQKEMNSMALDFMKSEAIALAGQASRAMIMP